MNPPDFATLKGRAALLVNFLRENSSDASVRETGFQWPIEAINGMAMPGMLVNGTNALFWRQAVPCATLRETDRQMPWNSDSWAYITTVVVKEEEEDARQRLIYPTRQRFIYPGCIERYRVTSIYGDWEEAVGEIVMSALLHDFPEPLLAKLRNDTKQQSVA